MRKITFSKYQGTGNDFIMIDNLSGEYDDLRISEVQFLCNRKTGIGADGLILINDCQGFDFEVDYFNSDGSKSFCGNGARCSVAFAISLNVIGDQASFMAIDGAHEARIIGSTIEVDMKAVNNIERDEEAYVLDTGSPHYIKLANNAEKDDIFNFGKSVRYSSTYADEGINVNLMSVIGNSEINVETYERGVEDETLSCGTGVTACALVFMKIHDLNSSEILVHTKGGDLSVKADQNSNGGFTNIWLCGPAEKVFDGSITL